MGARALYLGNSVYRIHGTNDPSTIGQFVSSGCIRLLNEDIEDLYARVTVGTRVEKYCLLHDTLLLEARALCSDTASRSIYWRMALGCLASVILMEECTFETLDEAAKWFRVWLTAKASLPTYC